jgi:hypothetical protein
LHAWREFVEEYPIEEQGWYECSNYVALLSVPTEQELLQIADNAQRKGLRLSVFREPDLNNQVTAIVLEPGNKSRRLCGRLRLALGE